MLLVNSMPLQIVHRVTESLLRKGREMLTDGTNFQLEERVAHAFMIRLTGMPGNAKTSPPDEQ
jgi:hypothetical protein